jgi:hypothetical protein
VMTKTLSTLKDAFESFLWWLVDLF